MPRQIFQLKVSLAGVRPPVWRRVLVPAGYTLDRLHRVAQHAMGWRDCHLHSFEIDAVAYGEPDPDGGLALHDELDVRLDAVLGKGSRFSYTYDFGDWWEHDLVVEDALTADHDERYPICLDGERACPPGGHRWAARLPGPARGACRSDPSGVRRAAGLGRRRVRPDVLRSDRRHHAAAPLLLTPPGRTSRRLSPRVPVRNRAVTIWERSQWSIDTLVAPRQSHGSAPGGVAEVSFTVLPRSPTTTGPATAGALQHPPTTHDTPSLTT
ncbi:hypothetical protein GCM10009848_26620 [Micromonospora lupini]